MVVSTPFVKYHLRVEIKSRGGNREPPLRVAIDTLFFLQCSVGECSNINDLFHGLRSELNPDEWKQFIDSSKASFRLFCSIMEIICHWLL